MRKFKVNKIVKKLHSSPASQYEIKYYKDVEDENEETVSIVHLTMQVQRHSIEEEIQRAKDKLEEYQGILNMVDAEDLEHPDPEEPEEEEDEEEGE